MTQSTLLIKDKSSYSCNLVFDYNKEAHSTGLA